MSKGLWLAGALSAALLAAPSQGRPPPNPNPTVHEWFGSLLDPDTMISCCDEADCRPAEERVAADHHEVLIGGRWVAVPEEKILWRRDNPTGGAVLCWSPVFGIMCFVPGPRV